MTRSRTSKIVPALLLSLTLLSGCMAGCMAGVGEPGEVAELPGELTGDPRWGHVDGEVSFGQWVHYEPLEVSAGTQVRVHMSGTGDADLYLRFDGSSVAAPYACAPELAGSEEVCLVEVPEGVSEVYLSVLGQAEGSSEYGLDLARMAIYPRRVEEPTEVSSR